MRISDPTVTDTYRLDRYILGCMEGSFSTSVDGWIGRVMGRHIRRYVKVWGEWMYRSTSS
jgi:hypothetical protein